MRVAEFEVEVVDDEDDDAAGRVVHWPGGRQNDALANRGDGGALRLIYAAAVHERKRAQLLLDAVFVHFEIIFREVRLKLSATVADDYVGADEVNGRAEGRARRDRRRGYRRWSGSLSSRLLR